MAPSPLTSLEKRYFEDLFAMGGGYVLDLTNASFAGVVRDAVDIDIYNEKFGARGGSKACRLRAFWDSESAEKVGKVLAALIGHWEYRQEKSGAKIDGPEYRRCKSLTLRLLGRAEQQETSDEEFLSRRIEDVPLSELNIEASVLPTLEKRFKEVQQCMAIPAPLAVVFHCGSILEGALLGAAQANPKDFNQAISSPKDDTGKVLPFHEWKLSQFIDAAYETKFLPLDVKKFSHVLRDFRNYIHPYEQIASKFDPDEHTARICVQVLRAAIFSLAKKR